MKGVRVEVPGIGHGINAATTAADEEEEQKEGDRLSVPVFSLEREDS